MSRSITIFALGDHQFETQQLMDCLIGGSWNPVQQNAVLGDGTLPYRAVFQSIVNLDSMRTNAMVSSSNARTALGTNWTTSGLLLINYSDMAVGKLVYAAAGGDPSICSGLAFLQTDSSKMTTVYGSSAAMLLYCGSTLVMNNVIYSSSLMTGLNNDVSQTAMFSQGAGYAMFLSSLYWPVNYAASLRYGRGWIGGGISSVLIDAVEIRNFSDDTRAVGTVLSAARYGVAACSSKTQGWFGGSGSYATTVDIRTFGTDANAVGTALSVGRGLFTACGSPTKGWFCGGYTGSMSMAVDMRTYATDGNASGTNLSLARYGAAACSSTTKGWIGGGNSGSYQTTMDVRTFSNDSNAGGTALSQGRTDAAACSNSTGGWFAGGTNGTDLSRVDVRTFSNDANAVGTVLGTARTGLSAAAGTTKGWFGGGLTGGTTNSAVVDIRNFSNDANAVGTVLYTARQILAGCSNSHGGLF